MALFSMNVDLEPGDAQPMLATMLADLGTDRRRLNEWMAPPIEQATRDYIRATAAGRHKSAESLGAEPTGFLSAAADTVQARGTADGVELGMQRQGLSRAFRDYDIRPLRARMLTIPVAAKSYGRRAREFGNLKVRRLKTGDNAIWVVGMRGGLFLGEQVADQFFALFRLVRQAHIPQDRTLLPTDEQWLNAAEEGATAWFESLDL